MRILNPNNSYMIFEFSTEAGHSWNLCLVDDYWWWWKTFLGENNPPTREKVNESLQGVRGQNGLHIKAVGWLPFCCEALPSLCRLIIGDFPRNNQTSGIDYALQLSLNSDVAFLIDINDDSDDRSGDPIESVNNTLSQLERANFPMYRCAYFTVGSNDELRRDDLERILKDEFFKNGEDRLKEWWGRVQNRISYQYFLRETTQPSRHSWHHPGEIGYAIQKNKKEFLDFVGNIARRDCYGVWDWILDTLENTNATLDDCRFAYFCGKAFLASGEEINKEELKFRFPALRGLLFGQGIRKRDLLYSQINEIGVELPRDFDDLNCLGYCSTGKSTFEAFANTLRNWFLHMEQDPGGDARLKEVQIRKKETIIEVELTFTSRIPPVGIGLVTKSWEKLHGCFDSDLQPCAEGDKVTLRFRMSD